MSEQLRLGDIEIDVVFKDIKNVHLGVYPPAGRVRIAAPERMSLEAVRLFAIGKLGWIKAQQRKLLAQEREAPREYLERESHYLWGKRYLLEIHETKGRQHVSVWHKTIGLHVLPNASQNRRAAVLEDFYRETLRDAARPLIQKWEKSLGVKVERFFIQKMKTMWGSCNAQRKTIRLNLELVKKPSDCLDYVVLHEMCHLLVPDHGERFVALLDQHMPGWETIRQRLNEAPLSLTHTKAEEDELIFNE